MIDQKKPEPDGWIACHPEEIRDFEVRHYTYNGGYDPDKTPSFHGRNFRVWTNKNDCTYETLLTKHAGFEARGWQIKPVWLSSEQLSGWISVKERLPNTNDEVLAYSPKLGAQLWQYFQYEGEPERVWTLNSYDGNEGLDTHTFDADDPINPTHWQPLPTPPDLEKENEK